MARDMMLTMDEYLALRRLIESERESEGAVEAAKNLTTLRSQKRKRRVSKYQKTLGKEIAIFDAKARLKNGSYRAGWDRAKVMRLAHKATRKILNMR